MQRLEFDAAVEVIVARDGRYERDAYHFLRESLDFTVQRLKKLQPSRVSSHVSGQELLEGIRAYAIKQFGPMVVTVFEYWGIRRCEDFGEMVYLLIQTGAFGQSATDSKRDFEGGYTFHDAFVVPYLPRLRGWQSRGAGSNEGPNEAGEGGSEREAVPL
jgi:uncharacterized repeat protein (TIGR04138 family)